MDSSEDDYYFKGVYKLRKILFQHISQLLTKTHIFLRSPDLLEDFQDTENKEITIQDLEAYFKANILLQFGIMGYMGFPFKILEFFKDKNYFIAETNDDCLTKLQLIVFNHFPALSPVDFSCNILNCESEIRFKILKYDASLSALIEDDLHLNTT